MKNLFYSWIFRRLSTDVFQHRIWESSTKRNGGIKSTLFDKTTCPKELPVFGCWIRKIVIMTAYSLDFSLTISTVFFFNIITSATVTFSNFTILYLCFGFFFYYFFTVL